jgi:hypothetical protein
MPACSQSPTGNVLSSQPLWPIWSWNEVWDPSLPDQTWNQLIYTGLGVDQYNGTGTQICFQLGAPCPSISDLVRHLACGPGLSRHGCLVSRPESVPRKVAAVARAFDALWTTHGIVCDVEPPA